MVNQSLGLIEVVGLAAALEAADAAVKAANVELIGYELTKGGGLVLIKLCGDVGAVTAGVEAGRMAASKVNKVWSTLVIPRPHQQLSCIFRKEQTIGVKNQPTTLVSIDNQVFVMKDSQISEQFEGNYHSMSDTEAEEQTEAQSKEKDANLVEQVGEDPSSELDHGDVSMEFEKTEKKPTDICNLCNDPACHRKKGDPKITCIYFGKK